MFFGGRPLGRGVVVVCNFDKRLETLTSRLVWPLWFVCISTHTTAAAVRTVRIDNFSQGIMLASAVGGLFLFRVKHLLECAAVVVVFGNLSRRRRRRRRSTKMFHFYFPVCTKEKGRTKSLSLYLLVVLPRMYLNIAVSWRPLFSFLSLTSFHAADDARRTTTTSKKTIAL